MIDPDNQIGYIRIALFTEKTAEDFKGVLEELEGQGLKGLVLDLRSNPGGRVDAAVKVVENFIEKGMIVSIRPRFGMPTYYSAQKNVRKRNYPITILIDSHTASAGEIVAGALQDEKHRRAILVGERSFGKGSVQNIKSLEGKKAKLKLTEAYYHLPSGRNVEAADIVKKPGISSWGVAPDVEIVLNPNERNKVAELMTANETLLAGGKAKSPDRLRRYSNIETISYDPQLYTAMLVLKAKMIGEGLAVK
jgi:carboxyl-terminal processing protease